MHGDRLVPAAADGLAGVSQDSTEQVAMTVLLVDDQPIIAEAVRRMLSAEPGLRFVCCSVHDDAVATALRVQPTVILQDLMMDDLDGLDLVRAYRAHPALRDLPVVVLSASEEAQNKVEAFRAGADDYVVKLPSALELLARVRYHSLALLNARQRVAAFDALLESRAALEARNREIDAQRLQLEQQAAALARANLELQESAFTDPLTGLRNRRYFRHLVDTVLRSWYERVGDRPPRHSEPDLALYLLDVDHFKQVNDRWGHDTGDRVLCEVAVRLQQCMRDGDAVIRWGGEEFLVVALGSAREAAARLAGRILEALGGHPMVVGDHLSLRITASLGWALYPALPQVPQQVSIERALYLADAGVYLSKRQGRNRGCGIVLDRGEPDPALYTDSENVGERLQTEDGRSLSLQWIEGPSGV